MIHEALSQINSVDEIDFVIDNYREKKLLDNSNIETLKSKIIKILNHNKIKKLFSNQYKILNEKEILSLLKANLDIAKSSAKETMKEVNGLLGI